MCQNVRLPEKSLVTVKITQNSQYNGNMSIYKAKNYLYFF